MDKAATLQIERKSSIENEPRTLNIDQIQFAREAALSVLKTRSIEEALSVFTEGLEPVVSVARSKRNMVMDSEEDCNCFVPHLRLPSLVKELRDVATAPF